ncbi:hypothetical protein AAC387_Pa05g1115 [Persea americana]
MLGAVRKAQTAAKANGYSDVLYLDSVHKRYLEEVSSCNVFVVKVLCFIVMAVSQIGTDNVVCSRTFKL